MPWYSISACAIWSEWVENPSGGEAIKTTKDTYLHHRFRAPNDNVARTISQKELNRWADQLPKEKSSGITIRDKPVIGDIYLSRRIRRS